MIANLTGTITEINAPEMILRVGDISYELFCPLGVLYTHKTGDILTIHTHLSVKEDSHTLFGFLTKNDKQFFRALIKISGIGPKVALAILSYLPSNELIHAIENEDDTLIAKTPGIGKKTAQKLIIELKSSLPKHIIHPTNESSAKARAALTSLGFNNKEISSMLKGIDIDLPTEEFIKQALKNK